VAEDNHDERAALKALLYALGRDVVCEAENGQFLVEAVSQTQVDLVITDLVMPVLDGLEAAEQIAAKEPVPIILLSGHSDTKNVVTEKEPVTLTLRKPVTADSLQAGIELATNLASGK
jgi:CheY-like chemotaxis protein